MMKLGVTGFGEEYEAPISHINMTYDRMFTLSSWLGRADKFPSLHAVFGRHLQGEGRN